MVTSLRSSRPRGFLALTVLSWRARFGAGAVDSAPPVSATGHQVLGVDLTGDCPNAIQRGALRTLMDVPIGGAMIGYLPSGRVRACFPETGGRAP